MKKQLLTAVLLAMTVLTTSCVKDVFDIMNHPIDVEGEIDPNFQLPLASSDSIHLGDLMSMLSSTFSAYLTDDDVITFTYSGSFDSTINVGNLTAKKHHPAVQGHRRPGTKDALVRQSQWVEYTLPIDFFDDLDLGSGTTIEDISIGQLLLTLDARISGDCPDPEARQKLIDFGSAIVDSLHISCVGKNNAVFDTLIPMTPLVMPDVVTGGTLSFDHVNLAKIFNMFPKSITFRFRIELAVDESILANPEDVMSFEGLLDSLQMTSFHYGADFNVLIPFDVHIGRMVYNYPVDITQSGEEGSTSSLEETYEKIKDILDNKLGDKIDYDFDSIVIIKFKVDNGIPLNIKLNGTFIDENNLPNGTMFEDKPIAAAPIDPVTYEANGTTPTSFSVPLNMETLEKFTNAKKIDITMELNTPGTHPVKVKKSDCMKLKMYVQIHPKIEFNWHLKEN